MPRFICLDQNFNKVYIYENNLYKDYLYVVSVECHGKRVAEAMFQGAFEMAKLTFTNHSC